MLSAGWDGPKVAWDRRRRSAALLSGRGRPRSPAAAAAADRKRSSDIGGEARHAPWLPSAVSRNMLPVFLIANVATGCINMATDTLTMPDLKAQGIVLAYVTCVAAAAVGLDLANLTLRF